MFSNQSVRVHESLPPTAKGIFPAATYLSAMATRPAQSVGGWTPKAANEAGLYHIVLFEFALTATPYNVPSAVPRSSQAWL